MCLSILSIELQFLNTLNFFDSYIFYNPINLRNSCKKNHITFLIEQKHSTNSIELKGQY